MGAGDGAQKIKRLRCGAMCGVQTGNSSPGKTKAEVGEFQASIGYIVGPSLKMPNKIKVRMCCFAP